MRRSGPILVVLHALAGAQPAAADWRTNGFFAQSATLLDRGGNDGARDDTAFRTTTDLGLSFSRGGAATQITLSPGVRLFARTDAVGGEEDWTVTPRFQGAVRHRAPRIDSGASLSVTPQFLSERQIRDFLVEDPDTGEGVSTIRTVDPLEITILGRADAALRIDSRNRLVMDLSARFREYDETTETVQPNQTFRGALSWRRDVTALTQGGITVAATRAMTDRGDVSDSTDYALTGTVRTRFTRRHSVGLTFGPRYSVADDGDDDFGLVGGADFAYRVTNTVYRLGLNQTTQQDADGALQTAIRASASARHDIDRLSSVSAVVSAQSRNDIFSGEDFEDDLVYGFNIAYERTLAKDWRANLGFRTRFFSEDDELESSVFFSISRNFAFLP